VQGGRKVETNNQTKIEASFLLLRVAVSTGATNVHVYSLPNTQKEASKVIKSIIEPAASALEGKTGFLLLANPSITYNAKHIVYIEAIFEGRKELE
jgi:hypothetical protein